MGTVTSYHLLIGEEPHNDHIILTTCLYTVAVRAPERTKQLPQNRTLGAQAEAG